MTPNNGNTKITIRNSHQSNGRRPTSDSVISVFVTGSQPPKSGISKWGVPSKVQSAETHRTTCLDHSAHSLRKDRLRS